MRCSQEPSLIHRDVSTLARVLGVHGKFVQKMPASFSKSNFPDLTSKADVRKFMRQDEERHLYLLKEAFLVAQKHDHALAALVILWARLCVDEAYRYMIFGDRLESRVVVAAIDWRRCNCCIVAGLQLICTMLSTYALDVGETMIDEVLPAMFELMAQTHENTLVHELCVRAIKQLSKTFYSAAYEKHLRKFMLVLVRHLPTMHFPSALKAVMHSVTICGTAMARDDIHFSYDEPILEFFVGLLRAGYPRARRFALRWITMSTKAKERPLKPGYFLGSRERALPADVRAGMEEYGWESCDSVRLARCLEAFYDVFKGFTIKRDLRYLGLRLYCIISEDPSAVTFDDFFARRTGIGKRKPRHFGVDCDAWHDVLERCAAVIRGLSRKDLLEVVAPRTLQKRTALDVADVLLLQHSFFTKDTKQRVYIGYDMMQRQTSDPYLAYALTTIKELKKTSIMDIGMSRIRDFYDSDATPFHLALANYIQLRYFLVCYDEGVLMGDEGIWKDISHNVETVRDLCEEYLAVTSLDARDRACVLEIYIALYLLFLGPDEPDTLEQIQASAYTLACLLILICTLRIEYKNGVMPSSSAKSSGEDPFEASSKVFDIMDMRSSIIYLKRRAG